MGGGQRARGGGWYKSELYLRSDRDAIARARREEIEFSVSAQIDSDSDRLECGRRRAHLDHEDKK